jgi:kumamolisin
LLYQKASTNPIFNSITSGDNGAFSAGPGWNPCTGLGSPIGTGIAAALGVPPAAQAAKSGA